MKTHYLKVWPQFFAPSWSGQKRFELRINDRDFDCGDVVVLQEWDPDTEKYTRREIEAKINYVMDESTISELMGLDQYANYVILSLAEPFVFRENAPLIDPALLEPPPGTPEPMQLTPVIQKATIVFDEGPEEREKAEIMGAHKEKLQKAWVPKWLEANEGARLGLGVLVDPGQEPNAQEWKNLWEERVRKEWDLAEDPRSTELLLELEEMEGIWVGRAEKLLELLPHYSPPLYLMWRALQGEKEAKEKLLELYPQEDPVLDPEEALAELKEASLEDLVGCVALTDTARANRQGP
jgi:hypothetical protein